MPYSGEASIISIQNIIPKVRWCAGIFLCMPMQLILLIPNIPWIPAYESTSPIFSEVIRIISINRSGQSEEPGKSLRNLLCRGSKVWTCLAYVLPTVLQEIHRNPDKEEVMTSCQLPVALFSKPMGLHLRPLLTIKLSGRRPGPGI